MAACAQMAQFYDIPCAVSAGMTDSKMPDFQAGYEKGYTELLERAGRRQPDLRGGRHVRLAAGLLAGELRARQRPDRRGDARHTGDRGQPGNPVAGNHPRGLHRRARAISSATTRPSQRMQSDYYYPDARRPHDAPRSGPRSRREGPAWNEARERTRPRSWPARPPSSHRTGDRRGNSPRAFPSGWRRPSDVPPRKNNTPLTLHRFAADPPSPQRGEGRG